MKPRVAWLVLGLSLSSPLAAAQEGADGAVPSPPVTSPSLPVAAPSRAVAEEPVAEPDAREVARAQELAALKRRVEAQESRITRLEAEARASKARGKIILSAFAQTDWVVWRQSSLDELDPGRQPLNEDRFVLRRARIRAEAERGYVAGAVEIDVNTINGPQVRPFNAEATLRWPEKRDERRPWLEATTGLILTPFGMETQELERSRLFTARPTYAEALFPGSFDLGLRLGGGYRFVRYAIAAMNGDPIGEKTFPGRDPNKSKDLVGRVAIDTTVEGLVHVRAGMSAVTGRGFHEGTPATKDTVVFRDANENGLVESTEIRVISGSAATPSEGFRRFGLGADARVDYKLPIVGSGALFGEIVRASNLDRSVLVADPVATGRDLRELGWEVGLTQSITSWAAVGARYDRYDPDADAREEAGVAVVPRDRSQSAWAFAAMLHDPHLIASAPGRAAFGSRVVAEYDHVTNARGRAADGSPATLKDDRFTLRFEVSF